MTVCTVIVNDALALLNLNNGILPVDPRHQARAFTVLVDLLKTLRGDNVYLVRRLPAAVTDDLREKPYATSGLKEMLARAAAPYLQAVPPATLGDDGERVLRNAARQPISCSLPDTLPRGSGNAWFGTASWAWQFYAGFDWSDFAFYGQASHGGSDTYYADFDGEAVMRNTPVASVAWSVEGGTVAISAPALTANFASAQLLFTAGGHQKVRARATFANGQVCDYLFSFEVN